MERKRRMGKKKEGRKESRHFKREEKGEGEKGSISIGEKKKEEGRKDIWLDERGGTAEREGKENK